MAAPDVLEQRLRTPLTELFSIKHPVMLAGMNVAAGPKLAAAVTNAGGLGVIGGVNNTPKQLQTAIDELKEGLHDPAAPFGVDLLLPKVGEGARATNYDYTKGTLDELVDIIIKSGARLFVCAVGVPPPRVVQRLHGAQIPIMNMVGAVKHLQYALDAGVDIICAQGGEGGGHTGDVATSILIPRVVDACRGARSPLTGDPVHVVAAGGIFDSRGLAASLAMGAQVRTSGKVVWRGGETDTHPRRPFQAVWVGTRFVASEEAGAPPRHKKAVVQAGDADTHRTLIYTGRPLRIIKNKYSEDWEQNRAKEVREITASGRLPYEVDFELREQEGRPVQGKEWIEAMPLLCGAVCGAIDDVLPAKAIVDEMVEGAANILQDNAALVCHPGGVQARL